MHMAYRKHAGVAALSALCLSLLIRRSVVESPARVGWERNSGRSYSVDLIRCSCFIKHVIETNTYY